MQPLGSSWDGRGGGCWVWAIQSELEREGGSTALMPKEQGVFMAMEEFEGLWHFPLPS